MAMKQIKMIAIAVIALTQVTSAMADDTIAIKQAEIIETTSSPAIGHQYNGRTMNRLSKLMDNVSFTSWAGKSDKTGTWLNFNFVGKRYISKFVMIAGCAGSNRIFSEFSRPKAVELKAGDRVVKIAVADKRRPQEFQISPPLAAESVTVRVTGLYAGRTTAVCMSEVRFFEQSAFSKLSAEKRMALDVHVQGLVTVDAQKHVRALVKLGPAAVPRLSAALTHPSGDVQKYALQAFEGIASPSSAHALHNFYKNSDDDMLSEMALRALVSTGHEIATGPLVETLTSENSELAAYADRKLQYFPKNILTFVRPLLDSPYEEVVERGLEVLRHSNDKGVVQAASPFARHRLSTFRRASAVALTSTRTEAGLKLLAALTQDAIASVRVSATKALRGYQPNAVRPIFKSLLQDSDEEVVTEALHALSQDVAGTGIIINYVQKQSAPFGENALTALAQTRSNRALHLLIDWLREGNTRFRRNIQAGIASYGKRGVSALLDAAITDNNLRVDAQSVLEGNPRIAAELVSEIIKQEPSSAPAFAISALNKTAVKDCMPALDLAFESGGEAIKLAVISAWGKTAGKQVERRLVNAMVNNSVALEVAAVRSIGTANIRSAGKQVESLLGKSDVPARVIFKTLSQLGDARAEPEMVRRFPRASMDEQFAILHACNELGTMKCTQLIYSAATFPNTHVRSEALRIIARN